MANLTIIILTKNEEQNLEKCIASFKSVAQRIVIIDSYSTDKTVELAKSLGAEVYEHPFENHAVQFNWALDNIDLNTEWVMKVDADEEFTSELADEIDEKLDTLSAKVNGVILRRRVYFMGRWLKHGGKYPELLLRIFRVGHGMSEMKLMDEHLIVTDGDVVTFKNDFSDNNNKSLEWWINKHNWYSNKEVLDQQMKSDDANGEESVEETSTSMQAKVKRFVKNHGYYSLPKFFRAHLYFIYRYYFRFGFLDGTEGKIYTFLQAYWYRYLVDAKLYECEKLGVKMEKQGALEATSSRINGGVTQDKLVTFTNIGATTQKWWWQHDRFNSCYSYKKRREESQKVCGVFLWSCQEIRYCRQLQYRRNRSTVQGIECGTSENWFST